MSLIRQQGMPFLCLLLVSNEDTTEKLFLLNQQALISAGERNSKTSAWRRLGISLRQQLSWEKALGGSISC